MAAAVLGVERSVSGRRWRSRLADDRAGLALAQRLDLPEIVGRVLAARGVGPEDAEGFLNPTLRRLLPDPLELRDMDAAIDRLVRALAGGEPVGIFADYDVDGATAAALIKRFVESVGGRALVYIPDRLGEGYGPNLPALLDLARQGARLIVTVDCGTTAHGPLAAAGEAGLEIIVVDHHLAEPRLPGALAVVNPNRLDEPGRFGELAAVGVAFLLVVGMNRALRERGWFAARPEPDLRRWLDLVALGTVCDVVPLTGVNRALVAQGLKVLARRGNVGLAALADAAALDERPDTYHAAFILGPRINAGGRVGRSDLGARLLSTEDENEARGLARELDGLNAERRAIEGGVLEAALAQLERRGDALGPVPMAVGEGWHPGVIGIVASRLVERFHRPVFVVALEGATGKGSGRSMRGVDLGASVTAARQAGLLINGGGHPMAAGFTVEAARLCELEDFLAARLGPVVSGLGLGPSLGIDGTLSVAGATPELVATLERVGPFGAGNPEPRFAFTDGRVVRSEPAGERHVRCILAGERGGRLKAIAFRVLDTAVGRVLMQSSGAPLLIAGHLRPDRFRGRDGVQLFIDDVAPARPGSVRPV
ncbi:MAG: single-stranded-DNA-specific exonuclease RecJ [Alphaproteobacteria bacterium]